VLALPVMPISNIPRSCRRRVVRAQYPPGANPNVIAETVATPIEEGDNSVEGDDLYGSQANTDGLGNGDRPFKLGTDPTWRNAGRETESARPSPPCLRKSWRWRHQRSKSSRPT